MAQFISMLAAIGLLLAACSENSDEAYERGYHDGWAETCNKIARFSSSIEQELENERIC